MMRIGYILILAVIWVALTGSLSPGNIILGLGVALACVAILRHEPGKDRIRPTWAIVSLFLLFAYELIVSAFTVAKTIVSPRMRMEPAIVVFPLRLTRDFEITLLSSLITLTPGTLTVDVSPDRTSLMIHALDASDPDALVTSLRDGFEAAILKAFRR